MAETAWPYPGFDPTGAKLASIFEHELRVLDVERLVTLASMGQRSRGR